MNSKLFVVIILCFVSTSIFKANAQININTNPYWKGEIRLLDGTSKKGLILVPNSSGEDYIAYKSSENGNKETFRRKLIDYVVVASENGRSYLYENIPVAYTIKGITSKNTKLLLVAAKNNYVTFYVESGVYKVDEKTNEIYFLYRSQFGNDLPATYYFIRKQDASNANLFALSGNNIVGLNSKLKKSAKYHLTETPDLIKKIEKKELKHNDVPKIISQYISSTNDM
ncbi:hypothetical protein [Hanstruepera ponticola]|uniref:hypothetical protein n=1 Tax=Hanstruepera ponticola TaxID=2042995 RepID=UPI00177D56E1|nr:hypothetical protein [Hanstruepera ponticola]